MITRDLQRDLEPLDARERVAWGLSALLAVVVGAAGLATLMGWTPLVETFAVWDLPAGGVVAVGALLLLLAVGVLHPGASFYAAFITAGLMLGAVGSYLTEESPLLALMPAAVGLAAVVLCVARLPDAERHFDTAVRPAAST